MFGDWKHRSESGRWGKRGRQSIYLKGMIAIFMKCTASGIGSDLVIAGIVVLLRITRASQQSGIVEKGI
jgi:hypothetical protein